MRWQGRRESTNVEDRRSVAGPVAVGGGIGVLLLALLVGFFGGDPQQVLQQAAPQAMQEGAEPVPLTPEEEERGQFATVVLADTEDVWNEIFAEQGIKYREPTLVLFSGQVSSGCGSADASSGPFYCPADSKLYLDTRFFVQLDKELGAPGNLACAYVIAHEVGHHIQNLLGTTTKMEQLRRQVSAVEYNDLSVRLELQADFFAGVTLHHTQKNKAVFEEGDIEEALQAATAIGDDTLQARSGRPPRKETFTHGSGDQRLRWFKKGLATGDITQGDTFATKDL